MKNIVKLAVGLVCLLGIGILGLGMSDIDIKDLMYEDYYVQITADGDDVAERENWNYFYELPAYNKKGKELQVEFYADKNLRKDAYLRVQVIDQSDTESNGIHSYEEVSESELPSKVKEKFSIK
ncbi:MAG: YxeA family protein [Turicibacter sp.]